MSDLDRPRLALYVALGLVVCFLGARYLRAQGVLPGAAEVPAGAVAGTPDGSPGGDPPAGNPAVDPPGGDAGSAAASVRIDRAAGGLVTVHVAGEVRRPGLYRLAAGARVDDALRQAGGPRRRADLTAVNLAAKLEDGRQILVPRRGAVGAVAGGAAPGAGAVPGGGAGSAPAAPVNLNTATLEQLDTLDGVGPGIARRILDYREQHGGFKTVDELAQVPGIGPKRLATLKPLVSV